MNILHMYTKPTLLQVAHIFCVTKHDSSVDSNQLHALSVIFDTIQRLFCDGSGDESVLVAVRFFLNRIII